MQINEYRTDRITKKFFTKYVHFILRKLSEKIVELININGLNIIDFRLLEHFFLDHHKSK